MAVDIDAKDVDASISIISGLSKTKKNADGSPRKWTAVKVVVGDWSQLFFAKSKFEMDYLIKCLGED